MAVIGDIGCPQSLKHCPLEQVTSALRDVHTDLSELHQDNADSHEALRGLLTRCVEAIERIANVVESNGFHPKRNAKRNWLRRLTGRRE